MVFKMIVATFVVSAGMYGETISLTNDFSISNGNPNGQWSYLDGSTLLSPEVPLNNGNPGYPAFSNGYWGRGNNLDTDTPDFGKTQVNGTGIGETDLDLLAGDIVGHSPNDGSTLFVTWTAPSAGFVSNLNFAIWYAHSAAGARSNDFQLLDNSTVLDSGTVSLSVNYDRDHPAIFSDIAGFGVAEGDTISIGIAKSSGEQYGSLDGQFLDFTFESTVPEPASGVIVLSGLGALIFWRKRIIP